MSDKLNHDRPEFSREHKRDSLPRTWVFSFGAYKGKSIYSVPTDYLIRLRHKSSIMEICRRCSDEIERRKRIAPKKS